MCNVCMTEDCMLQQDMENISNAEFIEWDKFRGKSILITGATGLIGSQLVMAMVYANIKKKLDMKVYALIRNRGKAEKMLASCIKYGLFLVEADVTKPIVFDEALDFIIHGASVTSSKDFVNRPVETILTALKGTEMLLNLAKEKEIQGMVYLSSMEAYGVVDEEHYNVTEKDYGYIDPLEVRSSYSEGKRMTEGLCSAYAHEYGVPVKIARLAQTFGAGIAETENRVFAQFARSIIKGEDIVLHTDGSKAHCYCYTSDAVLGILTILLKGTSGEAYNVSNQDTFSTIRELAEMLIERNPKSESKLVFDIPEDANKFGYAPSSKMLINSEKLMELGWKPKTGLSEMFERLIISMKQTWEEFC